MRTNRETNNIGEQNNLLQDNFVHYEVAFAVHCLISGGNIPTCTVILSSQKLKHSEVLYHFLDNTIVQL